MSTQEQRGENDKDPRQLQDETKAVIGNILLLKEKNMTSSEISDYVRKKQTLKAENNSLARKLKISLPRPCPGPLKWQMKWMFGVGDVAEEQYDLIYQLLVQLKMKGASEDNLLQSLRADYLKMRVAMEAGRICEIKDFVTFQMTEKGYPFRQVSF